MNKTIKNYSYKLEEVEENVYVSSVIKLQLELIDESDVEEDDD